MSVSSLTRSSFEVGIIGMQLTEVGSGEEECDSCELHLDVIPTRRPRGLKLKVGFLADVKDPRTENVDRSI